MKPEDRALFLQELAKLALIYRGFAASDPVAALWWQTLVDVEIGDMQRAVAEFMRGVDDFPTPGKIRALAQPEGDDEPSGRITREWERLARENAERKRLAKESANA